jgi:hypothetical protein
MRRILALAVLLACGGRTPLDGAPPFDAGSSGPFDASLDVIDASSDAPVFGEVAAPRAIAPLSTQTTTSRRPLFRWVLPSGVEGARVEICADRACKVVETSFDALGSSAKAPADLAAGLHFYRLRGIATQTIGNATDATREFVVPKRSAARDASWGSFPDFDGDGYADVIATGQSGLWPNVVQAPVTVFPGSSSGIHHKVRVEIPWADFIEDFAVAGDVDGDGLVDLVLVVSEALTSSPTTALLLCRGSSSPNMLSAPASIQSLTGANAFSKVAAAGDVNGDGYADVVVTDEDSAADMGHVRVYYGGATGLVAGPILATFSTQQTFGAAAELGDLDGDGVGDLVVGAHDSIQVFFGSPTGPSDAVSIAACKSARPSRTPGDLDGDGVPDLAATSSCGYGVLSGASKTWAFLAKPTDFPSLASSFAIAGDVDGDGYDDLVTSLGDLAGMLSYGSPTGPSDAHRAIFTAPHTSEGFVAAAGDLDRDGFMDVLLGEADNAYSWLYELDGSSNGPTQVTIVSPLVLGAWAEQTLVR